MNTAIDPDVLKRANAWLSGDFDDETRILVREMMEKNSTELTDAFYRDLEFGTGGREVSWVQEQTG